LLKKTPLLPSCPLSTRLLLLLLLEEDRLAEPLAALLLPVMSKDASLEGKPAAPAPESRPSMDNPRMGGAPPVVRNGAAGPAHAAACVAVSGVRLAARLLLPSLLSADARKVRLQVRCAPLPGT
jgi:hypothetical protein